jgi:signal transduction histidine kinase
VATTRSLADEQAALRRVATLVARQTEPAEVFASVAREVGTALDVSLISVVRVEGDTATQVGVWGAENPFPVGTAWTLDDHGVSGLVVRSGRAARIDDYADIPGGIAARLAREAGIRAAVGVPITVEGGLWGVMMALSTDAAPLEEGIETRLAAFTELIATAIANAQARDELRRLADEQAALRRVATLVARGAASAEIFDAVCEETGRLIGATNVNLAQFTSDGSNLTMSGWSIHDNHVPAGTLLPLDGDSINAIILRSSAPARVESYDGAGGRLATMLRTLGIRSEAGAPVVVDGRVWGALIAGTDSPEPLPPGSELRVASFAELIATAIANAEARSELFESRARIVTEADAARRRVARDLHDGAQQRLVSVVMNLQMAREKDAGDARSLVEEALEQAREGLEELRELAAGIHPSILTNRGLRAAAQSLARRTKLPVDVEVPADRYPPHVEAAAYFVIAEALTNVLKHAEASRAHVRAHEEHGRLIVEVEDDGRGGAHHEGSGVQGLEDRAAALGGTLELDSPPGAGTRMRLSLPL